MKKVFKCPECSSQNKKNILTKKDKGFICKNCNSFYPIYKGIPVLLSTEDDFYHVKKALSPAKYRVCKYEN
jgi:uncharacterized protein YbaR (Trm112 family)|tara:strand:+ start:474 stop:686 length:213 start_codon:yes stop_codon:yes gene_type:complete